MEFARRVKKNVPTDIIATGKLDASIALQGVPSSTSGPVWQGSGEVLALSVRSPLTNTRLALDKIPFTVSFEPRAGYDPYRTQPLSHPGPG